MSRNNSNIIAYRIGFNNLVALKLKKALISKIQKTAYNFSGFRDIFFFFNLGEHSLLFLIYICGDYKRAVETLN